MFLNPPKSTSMKLLISRPVISSTALMVQPGPPISIAELKRAWYPPPLLPSDFLQSGKVIKVSRGMLTAIALWRSALTCNKIVVSERAPVMTPALP